ncbi:hypothetical protein [Naasia sp. SYSU D00948]|uniref:hypothetical protein n=1 Tax=Naasia sp. SYSU D00948 TaxID=2817379 RepID=UPI001B310FC9|nr:hypothetical protein [Naasia sp. SYSU D00948]
MSFRNPVGPQPASVYWRRRILVLLGLIAAIAVVVLIVVRPGANAAPADPSPSPDSTAAAEPSAAPAATPTPTAAADPSAIAACAPGQVSVTAVTDKTTYGTEELPQLSFTIANVGAAPCTLNVGTTAQVFTITSGSDTIWTSTDCQTGAVDQPVTLAPGTPASSSPFSWERQRSSPETCGEADRPTVGADGASYHLSVSVGGFESAESAQFILG